MYSDLVASGPWYDYIGIVGWMAGPEKEAGTNTAIGGESGQVEPETADGTTSGGAGRVGEWRKRVLYYQWRCWQSG